MTKKTFGAVGLALGATLVSVEVAQAQVGAGDPSAPAPGATDLAPSTPEDAAQPSTFDDAERVTDPAAGPDAEAPGDLVPTPLPDAAAPTPVVIAPAPAPQRRFGLLQGGVGATVGGGLIGFTDEQTRAFTDVGGGWEARLTFGMRLPVAFEAAYVGSLQNIDALGLERDAQLVGNGAEGALRVNLTRALVQPYLFGGIGWTNYRVAASETNTSSIRGSDNVVNVPFGVGVAVRPGPGLFVDLRGTGRAAFDDDLMDAAYANTGEEARLHNWNVAARLGWEF